jgi:glycoprotein 3-alpha-L-fucosyltransferase
MIKFRKIYVKLLISIILILIILKLQGKFNKDTDKVKKDYLEYTGLLKVKNNEKVITQSNRLKSILKKYYIILEYTKIFGASKLCENKLDKNVIEKFKDDERFMKIFSNEEKQTTNRYNLLDNCEYKNCYFTCDHTFTNDADALLFHYTDLMGNLKKNSIEIKDLIDNRNYKQIWMLWQDEAAGTSSSIDYLKLNWTISYYTKAEASNFAYGGKTPKKDNDNKLSIQNIRADFEKRANSAIWFVSNCESKTRIKFASMLGDYFPITINGACVSLIDGKKSKRDNNKCDRESKCEMDYLSNNKFYLAFESTNCSDYITEKFWRTLSYGLIPIVLQPSRQSYERVAPPNSFIHAQDFNFDAQLLAQYLVNVSSDFDLYFKHIEWKISYEAYFKSKDVEPHRFCQLCTKLNTETASIYYELMSNWFTKQCHSVI